MYCTKKNYVFQKKMSVKRYTYDVMMTVSYDVTTHIGCDIYTCITCTPYLIFVYLKILVEGFQRTHQAILRIII